MRTYNLRPEKITRSWFVVDATDQILGRLATRVASHLRGKHKPEYSPHMDVGDYIIIINAKDIAVTGNKMKDKIYNHHSGYVGGIKSIPLAEMLSKHPVRVLEHAIKGMLPKNSLGRSMYRKLKVYPDSEHSHSAQCPESLKFD